MTARSGLARRLRTGYRPGLMSGLVPDAPLGDCWHVPPDWLSPLADDLDETARRVLSRLVLAGIHSANAHAERRFVASARRALRAGSEPALLEDGLSAHLRHLADEEDEHSRAFARFASLACGGLLPDRMISLAASEEPWALLLGRLLVTEEIIDALDLEIAGDPLVSPLVRAVHAAHHRDEARHLAFGRAHTAPLVAALAEADVRVHAELERTARTTWRAAFPVEAFRRAGLPEPAASREATWQGMALTDLRRRVETERLAGLARRGMLAGRLS